MANGWGVIRIVYACGFTVGNSLAVCLPESDERTLFDHVLDLGRRSDSVAIKSESTRVAVNIIKSLWSNDVSSADRATLQEKREAARKTLTTARCATALAQLIGRSRKYPLLVNEGVISLTLLSTGENGGTFSKLKGTSRFTLAHTTIQVLSH